MTRTIILAAAALLFLLPSVRAESADTSAGIAAAIADPRRPADEKAKDANRKPAEMVAFAEVKPGDVVVDVIPGKGYFTRIFAGVVGPQGQVYAYHASEFDAYLAKKNITLPTGTVPDYPNASFLHAPAVKLTVPKPADVIWTAQNYHDLHASIAGPADVAAFNQAVFAALKPGGLFIVLDHAAKPGSGLSAAEALHRIDPATVKTEVTAAGFVFVGESTVLRNSADDHTKTVFDPSIRGHTDQFVYKFRKP